MLGIIKIIFEGSYPDDLAVEMLKESGLVIIQRKLENITS